ncbi:hypothetical protein [Gramella sp. MAR_2010_147]|uniref:hypothetical protein n=1 Tax=Gramella sp. MAR_2010_147 TaxID=1250205 RepID=UPI00087C627C|nr:hypothetical protein [Gramella sp. MAR_2010_147]SDR89787.1 hypothetical protein SAMN04488553_0978 [Gramella sp. MAR_2010_147]
MNSIKTNCVSLMLIFLISMLTRAQDDRYQMYVVHEDHVKEGMMDKHQENDRNLLKAAKEHQMKDMSWLTFVADDNRVMYLSPIKSMAELDKNPFEDLQKKMGKEAFDNLFNSYNGTYSKHGDYILRMDNELSYMPNGMTTTPQDENYRELHFYHIPPGNSKKAEEYARSVKEMYTNKNSKVHYRLYKSGFGNMGSYYMVAVSAKSAEDMEQKRNENMQLLGEEGKKMFEDLKNDFSDQEVVTGYIKPELSYLNN